MYEIKLMIIHFSQWLYPWLGEIALAIMATLLVIYGETVNRMVKRQVSGMHFTLQDSDFYPVMRFWLWRIIGVCHANAEQVAGRSWNDLSGTAGGGHFYYSWGYCREKKSYVDSTD